MNNEFIDEIAIQEFATESQEHLEEVVPELLALEKKGASTSTDSINSIFRAVHSIKGGAGFLPFQQLRDFSHAMENVLMKIREGEMDITPARVDILLASVDRLRDMVQDIHASDSVDCSAESSSLQKLLSGETSPDTESIQQSSLSARVSETLYNSIALDLLKSEEESGSFLFHVRIDPGVSDEQVLALLESLQAVGTIHPQSLVESTPPNGTREFVIASVLEADLLTSMEDGLSEWCSEFTSSDWETLSFERAPSKEEKAKPQPVSPPAAPALQTKSAPETTRIRLDLVDNIINLVSELVLIRNQLNQVLAPHQSQIVNLRPVMQSFQFIMGELQETAMQTRLRPLGALFQKCHRLARDLERKLGKSISFSASGDQIEVDRNVIDLLSDPLTHIMRNSIDHGLEPPEERAQSGKSAEGKLSINAAQVGGNIIISIRDDGRGINPQKIRQKALSAGILSQSASDQLSDKEAIQLIFAPGFSTADSVTELSGRGVGLDVVRNNLEQLGGRIEIDSIVGTGTEFKLSLPVSLSIMKAMVVCAGNQRFAIPQINVVELLILQQDEVSTRIHLVHDQPVLVLRDQLIPIVRLSQTLRLEATYWCPATKTFRSDRRKQIVERRIPGTDSRSVKNRREHTDRRVASETNQKNLLVVRDGTNVYALLVDTWLDTEDIVVKPLSSMAHSPVFSGATLLGDGSVILILDVSGLGDALDINYASIESHQAEQMLSRHESSSEQTSIYILFAIHPDEWFAIRQKDVKRIHRIQTSEIQQIGNQMFIPQNGTGLPVFRPDWTLPIRRIPDDQDELYALVLPDQRSGEASDKAMLVTNVINTMELSDQWDHPCTEAAGILGTQVIQGRLVQHLDPQQGSHKTERSVQT